MPTIARVISGGQTGVDQAALRAAGSCGIPVGGWCPPGRLCEGGRIPDLFPLKEAPEDRSADAPTIPRSQRTEWNVRDSDATLIVWPSALELNDPGTRWTADCAARYQKPLLTCDPGDFSQVAKVQDWFKEHDIKVLNVAGPSENSSPGIGALAERFLGDVLKSSLTNIQQPAQSGQNIPLANQKAEPVPWRLAGSGK